MAAVSQSAFAWGCVLLGIVFLVPAVRRRACATIASSPRHHYVGALAACTFGLSLAYVYFYLRGGPRIIDATSYWLQAQVFADGNFTFRAPGPIHSFVGRFLVATPSGNLAVLFPPGFAALLAIGVRAGLPLMVNPLLGALCAVLTYALGRSWCNERVGRFAGVLSALCATLRYHSADTMSHAWCACLVLTLLYALTARPSGQLGAWSWTLLGGLCAGWLFATRPLTGIVFGSAGLLAGFWIRHGHPREGARTLGAYALGCAPGLALWLAYQWATTGSVFGSTQAVYYARSDWPSECFTLGFGSQIGCRFEHGDFLDDYQPNGFGPLQALAVCGRRLWVHLGDVANVPWIPFVSLLTLRRSLCSRSIAAIWGLLISHVAAYALFYYDGNYPGGGARLYAELLPLQHVLLASALTTLNLEWAIVPVAAIGFFVWSEKQHDALAEREGGRPMYQPSVVREAGIERGLIFIDTDHGFNLGFSPQGDPSRSPLVVRARGDALDYATWVNLSRPEAYRYMFDPYQPHSSPIVSRFTPQASAWFLGASLWPPIAAEAGSAAPAPVGACGSSGLSLHPSGAAVQRTQIQLWTTSAGNYRLEVRGDVAIDVAQWSLATAERSPQGCVTRSSNPRWLEAGPVGLTLMNTQPAILAAIGLRPTP